MRRAFASSTLMRLRTMSSEDALVALAMHCKADPTYVPIKDTKSRRWYACTSCGEFEILTTGAKWYDTRAKAGGGGAIDLAMHILHVPFVDAVKLLTAGVTPRG